MLVYKSSQERKRITMSDIEELLRGYIAAIRNNISHYKVVDDMKAVETSEWMIEQYEAKLRSLLIEV